LRDIASIVWKSKSGWVFTEWPKELGGQQLASRAWVLSSCLEQSSGLKIGPGRRPAHGVSRAARIFAWADSTRGPPGSRRPGAPRGSGKKPVFFSPPREMPGAVSRAAAGEWQGGGGTGALGMSPLYLNGRFWKRKMPLALKVGFSCSFPYLFEFIFFLAPAFLARKKCHLLWKSFCFFS